MVNERTTYSPTSRTPTSLVIRGALWWLLLVPIMIVNGTVRQYAYGPLMDELLAHQLSTATGILVLVAFTLFVTPRLQITTTAEALKLGLTWLTLTVLFEFGFGHWVAGHSWQRLLHDYDLTSGRLWSLILFATVLTPPLVFKLRRR